MLPDEPLLLEKLLKRARDTGNERLLAYFPERRSFAEEGADLSGFGDL